jgi:tetratricopeptide (TPR) repeat protein
MPSFNVNFLQIFSNLPPSLRKNVKTSAQQTRLISILFARAMAERYTNPPKALELFQEVVSLDKEHHEARIKCSWLMICLKQFSSIISVLQPIINPPSPSATSDQLQRAYNNAVCSALFSDTPDYFLAEKFAREGIRVNPQGNVLKLWEHLGKALQEQGRVAEARDAFNAALAICPDSDYAKSHLKQLPKNMSKKKRKGSTSENLEEVEPESKKKRLKKSGSGSPLNILKAAVDRL